MTTISRPPLDRGPQRTLADKTNFRTIKATGLGTFSAHKNADQLNIPDAPTKVTFDHVEYNPSNWYDATLSRFTPKQHGFYRFSCQIFVDAGVQNKHVTLILYKNGSSYKILDHQQASATDDILCAGTGIVKSGGTAGALDYWEIFTVHDFGAGNFDITVPGATEESNYFEAEFIAYQGS